MRYAHGDFPTGIMHNAEGLPTGPFIIDVTNATKTLGKTSLHTDDMHTGAGNHQPRSWYRFEDPSDLGKTKWATTI